MVAVPSIGRANRVERPTAPGADATTDLYERYSGQVFGYCLHQLGSREEAEDAVQTTFMNAFRGLARGIVPEAEQAWVFKIAHNVCLSRRRSSWRRGRIEAPNNMEVLQEVVPAKEKEADELIRLQDVLEKMPDSQRRAILLREWQGLSYREIGDELALSQAAVETLIFRARRSLASGLEEAHADGSWRTRLRRGADVGSVVAFLKAALGGGGAAVVKVATAVALTGAVATTAVDQIRPEHRAPAKGKTPTAVAQLATPDRAPAAADGVTQSSARVSLPRRAAPSVASPRKQPSGSRPVATTAASEAETSAVAQGPAPADPAPASVVVPQRAQPAVTAPAKPKAKPADATPKSHGNQGQSPHPAPPPASRDDTPGKGHEKRSEAEPQPAVQTAAAPEPTPAASADHGPAAAPGQQDKADKGGGGGNGRGK